MKTTKKACNLVPCLYIVQYMICMCGGGPTSIFNQGAPNPLATALCTCILANKVLSDFDSDDILEDFISN